MRIPNIQMTFKNKKAETDSAFLFLTEMGEEKWIPKKICQIISETKKEVKVCIAPFKFEEVTKKKPQFLTEFVIDDSLESDFTDLLPDYDFIFPNKITLFDKQLVCINKVKRLPYSFIYGEMRTGKTVMASIIAESRIMAKIANKLYIIAPLRAKDVWFKHLTVPFEFIPIEHFSNIHKRFDLNIFCDQHTLVILDESHKIKNSEAFRVEHLINLFRNAGQKIIMTGTPIGKHAGDLYHQFEFLTKDILGFYSYERFCKIHLLYDQNNKVVAYVNIDEITAKIAPFTTKITRNDIGIDRVKDYKKVFFSIKNRIEYNQLMTKFLGSENFTESVFGLLVKLQQSANGILFDENENVIGYLENGRIEILQKTLELYPDKQIVIYFKYNNDAEFIEKLGVRVLNGKTSQKEFNSSIDLFNKRQINILAIQQQISIGFSLGACEVMIYYSRKFGLIDSKQSEDRASESTEQELIVIDIIAENTIDAMIDRTITKQTDIISNFKNYIKQWEQLKV